MGQHFLLSPQARDLTISELASMQERTARKLFRQAPWPETDGEAYCPHCGNLGEHEDLWGRYEALECRATDGQVTALTWREPETDRCQDAP